jgi:hypothetical protein
MVKDVFPKFGKRPLTWTHSVARTLHSTNRYSTARTYGFLLPLVHERSARRSNWNSRSYLLGVDAATAEA